MKLLPSGRGQEAIADIAKFKDFSSLGDEIQTDDKLKASDYYKTSFTLSKSPANQLYGVEVIEPYKDASYCLDESKSDIPFHYVTQTSDNQAPKLEAKYVITFEREATKKEGTIQLSKGMQKEIISFPQAVSTLKGEGSNKARLTYDVYNTETKTKIESKSVDFSVRVPASGSSCADQSLLYSYKLLEEETAEEPTPVKKDGENTGGVGDTGNGAITG